MGHHIYDYTLLTWNNFTSSITFIVGMKRKEHDQTPEEYYKYLLSLYCDPNISFSVFFLLFPSCVM